MPDVVVFHAASKKTDEGLVTAGGRVLGVTGRRTRWAMETACGVNDRRRLRGTVSAAASAERGVRSESRRNGRGNESSRQGARYADVKWQRTSSVGIGAWIDTASTFDAIKVFSGTGTGAGEAITITWPSAGRADIRRFSENIFVQIRRTCGSARLRPDRSQR
jgi:hypothetical protein